MADANSSEFLVFFIKALPSGLKPYTSLRVHWLVLMMRVQTWGTSSSTLQLILVALLESAVPRTPLELSAS